ncbi:MULTISPECIES: hypothetical protein [unclassified Curtobacterium]|uniref:hypothetical protein n=1 Tax=unclassified Curtobacterium TaxID=257496 RepID=UPI000D9A7B96|nr:MULTISPECIES: hypothetical protein [unclassified Curtobacterium]PYY32813.1 hypothetical protein DEI89_12090 [Curtobacterium sp. MCBD17_030]PZE38520.1 hypothetical protein DEJ31_04375 [Curtobacterium sp. MCPF17_031]PZF10932.1 hypothetical protein DEJ25_11090 [Curtobacterium sp. MCPF17_011]
MFGRARRDTEPVDLGTLAPWQSDGVSAQCVPLPIGRKGKTIPGVMLFDGTVSPVFAVREVQQLVDHDLNTAENVNQPPIAFLMWPDDAADDSPAGRWLHDAPAESLTLLVDPLETPPTVQLLGPALNSFREWVHTLPR